MLGEIWRGKKLQKSRCQKLSGRGGTCTELLRQGCRTTWSESSHKNRCGGKDAVQETGRTGVAPGMLSIEAGAGKVDGANQGPE